MCVMWFKKAAKIVSAYGDAERSKTTDAVIALENT